MEPMDGNDKRGTDMKEKKGNLLPLGVSIENDRVNFSMTVPGEKSAQLLLYRAGEEKPDAAYEMNAGIGEVQTLSLSGLTPSEYEYNYLIDGKVITDPYAKALTGRGKWGEERDTQKHEVRGVLCDKSYDWEGDQPLHLPPDQVIAYGLHVRGFTKDSSSKVKHKGTFEGLVEKIPYLLDLGINQIQCMPVYEFEERGIYRNYWGYGNGFFFAPKSAYAAGKDPVKSLKDMIKAFHKAGIEVVLEMPFAEDTPKTLMEDCLRYYVIEYHADGFVLNPSRAPMDAIRQDPLLKSAKILVRSTDFRDTMRRFLKGDEGMIDSVIYWLRHVDPESGIFNYIADHTGFTLHDLVSYDSKHNESNGEQNHDGPDYNFSWNCGAEGPTRKKAVLELRKRQVRNAFFLVLLAQGTPYIQSGDEFGNSQKGNNNVYCQDNPTGWVNWRNLEKEQDLFTFVKSLISLRKKLLVLHPAREMQGIDTAKCGIPDVSYHGESAWVLPNEIFSRQLGVYYCGIPANAEDCFVAYNMHWLDHEFALPALGKEKNWYLAASTDEGVLKTPRLLKNQRKIELKARTIALIIGK